MGLRLGGAQAGDVVFGEAAGVAHVNLPVRPERQSVGTSAGLGQAAFVPSSSSNSEPALPE